MSRTREISVQASPASTRNLHRPQFRLQSYLRTLCIELTSTVAAAVAKTLPTLIVTPKATRLHLVTSAYALYTIHSSAFNIFHFKLPLAT